MELVAVTPVTTGVYPALHTLFCKIVDAIRIGYPFWAKHKGYMSNQEPSDYFQYIIEDADSYRAVLSGVDVEFSQLEPGRLSGRHVRLRLPGGHFSYVETNLSMRAIGTFPNLWTLSVILDSNGRSLQDGVEVRAGSLMIHGPTAKHDGVYGRNFKIICFGLRDEVFAKYVQRFSPQLQEAMRHPQSVFEPPADARREIIAHFAEAATIIQCDPRVRNARAALAKFEEELVSAFLEAVAQQLPSHSDEADRRDAAVLKTGRSSDAGIPPGRTEGIRPLRGVRSAATDAESRFSERTWHGTSDVSAPRAAESCASCVARGNNSVHHGDRCCAGARLLAPRPFR